MQRPEIELCLEYASLPQWLARAQSTQRLFVKTRRCCSECVSLDKPHELAFAEVVLKGMSRNRPQCRPVNANINGKRAMKGNKFKSELHNEPVDIVLALMLA